MYWNVLLRLDRPTSPMPPPFEQPSERHDFWVYEIDIAPQSAHPLQTIELKLRHVRGQIPAGSEPTLFVETDISRQPLTFPPSLLALLVDMGCGLEVHSD